MFDNIGGKMKGIASTAFLLGAVGACALGVAVKTVFRGKEGVLVGLIIAGLGVALAYFNSIRLYAYGQLVENSDIAVGQLREIKGQISKGIESATSQEAKSGAIEAKAADRQVKSAAHIHDPQPMEGMITCPVCGCTQRSNRLICWKCGTKLTSNDE